ncbi:TauD/TfdA family dioxygenase [Pseudoalteromonas sp. S16_S37]|uniref:TauD/TfdA family dioxygenase n=1 Tax=Pseudoalteromonas sp. S16_S37 TaxID=2720228 RepID=UPI001680CF88|nr:TauD/TfdA family dioxygenase [Pseudoalteromonas sp. S16_S37]MBD1581645.1 TauD/TfdA family dioxygenase [Pseudoalteromonas sp. S16_S37]
MPSNPLTFKSISVDHTFHSSGLPVLVQPINSPIWQDCIDDIQQLVEQLLHIQGGLLFRGFSVNGADDFNAFARSFGHDLLNYDYASTPRNEVTSGVYTSTEYPAHQVIPLHNEQAYTLSWPLKIWFHCEIAPEKDGETPIADSRRVYDNIAPAIRARFAEHGLLYVRNYGNGLDLSWQQAFGTSDKTQVEAFCAKNHIECIWKEDGELQTRQICQAVSTHPSTHEKVWFNQAHLFHVSNLDEHIKETLISIVGEENLPRNVYYGDGSPIKDEDLQHIRQVLSQCQVSFPWQKGDIMMLDNMLAAHGRSTFSGDRKVIVAMAQGYSEQR